MQTNGRRDHAPAPVNGGQIPAVQGEAGRLVEPPPPSFHRQCSGLAGLIALVLLGFTSGAQAQTSWPTATNLWVLPLTKEPSRSSPAIGSDGTIYQATFDGTLLAITAAGKISWTFNTGTETEIKSSPAIAGDGTIYFGSRNRKLYAVTPAGKLKWTFPTGGWVDSSPAIAADGTIYFGSWDKNFYALDPQGLQRWRYSVGEPVISSPAIAQDGTIYFGALDKKFYALTPDGRLEWTFTTDAEIISSPALGRDGMIYFTSTDGYLYALKPDGTEAWRFHTGGNTEASPVLDENGSVYIAGSEGEYVVTSAGKGHTFTGLATPVEIAAVAVNGQVYCSRPWRTLQANHSNGEVLWAADTARNLSASPVVGNDGVVYATCESFLYAIQPAGVALPPANSPWPMFRGNARHTGRVEK